MPLLLKRNGAWVEPVDTFVRAAGTWKNAKVWAKSAGAWKLVNGDPYIANVTALLNFDGSNGSTTITDASPIAAAWGITATAAIDTAQSKFGGSSLGVTSSSGGCQSAASAADYNVFGGDFTVEGWTQINSTSILHRLVSFGNSDANHEYVGVEGNVLIFGTTTSSNWANRITGTAPFNTGAFRHWALCKSGSTFYLFLDGFLQGTSTTTLFTVTNRQLLVGRKPSNAAQSSLRGWMDAFRLTKGVARYTANFMAPTAPFRAF
ncbi:hypothetical protein MPL3365_210106 [Mesorhizobium plurifarium]|uniref:Uncharacterized protein n=1 Tax=Mesorhizobium plurifarium TaxID=69974 RepID=A0A090G425_MESPL|nr:hypothetical protein MPL3365_210106 [Mesorhizobium plurifarium]